jgi:hypothetical protein
MRLARGDACSWQNRRSTNWSTNGRPNRSLRRPRPTKSSTTRSGPSLWGRPTALPCAVVGTLVLTPAQTHRPQVEALQRAHRHEPRVVQLLQLHRQRDAQGEGHPDAAHLWRRPLRPSRLLRHAGRTHEDRGRRRGAPGRAGVHHLRAVLFHHLQRHPLVLQARRHHRRRQGRQLCRPQGHADQPLHHQVVRAQRHGGPRERAQEPGQGAGQEAADEALHHHRGPVREHWRRG